MSGSLQSIIEPTKLELFNNLQVDADDLDKTELPELQEYADQLRSQSSSMGTQSAAKGSYELKRPLESSPVEVDSKSKRPKPDYGDTGQSQISLEHWRQEAVDEIYEGEDYAGWTPDSKDDFLPDCRVLGHRFLVRAEYIRIYNACKREFDGFKGAFDPDI
ncbi:hypothetical protein PM082_021081 [Marasmius tenuissimus]|nr:hypothetical protein PM082_021081 [Marasmius tenuissimus]